MSDSEDIPDEGDHVPDVDNDEASDDEETGDVDDDDRMEAITQDTLKGRWMHSGPPLRFRSSLFFSHAK